MLNFCKSTGFRIDPKYYLLVDDSRINPKTVERKLRINMCSGIVM